MMVHQIKRPARGTQTPRNRGNEAGWGVVSNQGLPDYNKRFLMSRQSAGGRKATETDGLSSHVHQ